MGPSSSQTTCSLLYTASESDHKDTDRFVGQMRSPPLYPWVWLKSERFLYGSTKKCCSLSTIYNYYVLIPGAGIAAQETLHPVLWYTSIDLITTRRQQRMNGDRKSVPNNHVYRLLWVHGKIRDSPCTGWSRARTNEWLMSKLHIHNWLGLRTLHFLPRTPFLFPSGTSSPSFDRVLLSCPCCCCTFPIEGHDRGWEEEDDVHLFVNYSQSVIGMIMNVFSYSPTSIKGSRMRFKESD